MDDQQQPTVPDGGIHAFDRWSTEEPVDWLEQAGSPQSDAPTPVHEHVTPNRDHTGQIQVNTVGTTLELNLFGPDRGLT